MQATIKINMDNDAFAGNPGEALAAILRDLAKHAARGENYRAIMDANGNKVGEFEIQNIVRKERIFKDGRWQTLKCDK